MSLIRVKAGPKATADTDGVVFRVETPRGAVLIRDDGKGVDVDARHKDVKAALADGRLVEMRAAAKTEDEKK